MDGRRRVHRVRAVRDRPRAHLVRPGGEERDQAEQPVGQGDDPVQPRLGDAELLHEHRRLVRLQLAELHLDPGREGIDHGVPVVVAGGDRAATRSPAPARSPSPTFSSTSTGFWVRNRNPRIAFSSSGSSSTSRIGVPGLERLVEPPQDDFLALVRLRARPGSRAGRCPEPLEAALGHRQVGQDELEVEALEVAGGVDAAVGMRDAQGPRTRGPRGAARRSRAAARGGRPAAPRCRRAPRSRAAAPAGRRRSRRPGRSSSA